MWVCSRRHETARVQRRARRAGARWCNDQETAGGALARAFEATDREGRVTAPVPARRSAANEGSAGTGSGRSGARLSCWAAQNRQCFSAAVRSAGSGARPGSGRMPCAEQMNPGRNSGATARETVGASAATTVAKRAIQADARRKKRPDGIARCYQTAATGRGAPLTPSGCPESAPSPPSQSARPGSPRSPARSPRGNS